MRQCPELTPSNNRALDAGVPLDYPNSASPRQYIELGSMGPIQPENLVDFHLLYSGPLHSSGSDVQRNEKHAIRKVFHSQLRHLWETHPNLVMMAEGNGDFGITQQESEAMPKPELFQRGVEHIARNWHRNGFQFLPLVTKKVCLRCSLDILFLRAEERNYVLQGGDIDRRLTILFDALRIAREASELPVGAKPSRERESIFLLAGERRSYLRTARHY